MECAECSHDNPPGTRFCQSCGAFLDWAEGSGPAPAASPVGRTAPIPARTERGGAAAAAEAATGLRAEVEPGELSVVPGEAGAATLTVKNTGSLVEEYVLRVEGPPWMSLAPVSLRVYPGEEATASLQAIPPRASASTAGRSGYRVTVTATLHPGVAAAAGGTVTLLPFRSFGAELSPATARAAGRTRHLVRLANGGNVPLLARLEATDPDSFLQFQLPPAVEVPPGQTVSARLAVQAPTIWFGRPQSKQFTVTVDPGAGEPPTRLVGNRTVLPRFPFWVPVAAALALAVGVVAIPRIINGNSTGNALPAATTTSRPAGSTGPPPTASESETPSSEAAGGSDNSSPSTSSSTPSASTSSPSSSPPTSSPPTSPAGSARFLGEWANTDPDTLHITRIGIAQSADGGLSVRMWGKCHPTDCDWGTSALDAAASKADVLSIVWDHGFETVTQHLSILSDGRLEVDSLTHFTDGSGRTDYGLVDYFAKSQ